MLIGDKDLMCSQRLRTYILSACQDPVFFGLRERPGKRADLYHSAYCLSGLSITSWSVKVDIRDMLQVPIAVRIGDAEALVVLHNLTVILRLTNPVFRSHVTRCSTSHSSTSRRWQATPEPCLLFSRHDAVSFRM